MNKQFGVKQLACIQMQAAMIFQLQSCGILGGLQDKSDEAFVQMRKAYDTGISGTVTILDVNDTAQAKFSSNIDNDYCIEDFMVDDSTTVCMYSVDGDEYFGFKDSDMDVILKGSMQSVMDLFGGTDDGLSTFKMFEELACPTNLIKFDRRTASNVDYNDSDGVFVAKYTTDASNIFGEYTMKSLEDSFGEDEIPEILVQYTFDSKTLDIESIQVTDEDELYNIVDYKISKTNDAVVIPEEVKSEALSVNDWINGYYDEQFGGYEDDWTDDYDDWSDDNLSNAGGQSDGVEYIGPDSNLDDQTSDNSGSGLDGWVKASDDAVDAIQSDDNTFVQGSDMLNEKAVNGIFFPGQSLSALNIAIADQVVSVGVDNIDNLYNQFKQYGAEMLESSSSKSFQLADDDIYVYVGSDDDGTVDYVQIEGLTALKACQIGEYKYGDTLTDFADRHGDPISIYNSDYGDSVEYTYCYCEEYGPEIVLRASDGSIIDEITIYFND